MHPPIVDDRELLRRVLWRSSVAIAQAREDVRNSPPRVLNAGARLIIAEGLLDDIVTLLLQPPPGEPRNKGRRRR